VGSGADFVIAGAELRTAKLNLETLGFSLDEDAGIGFFVEDLNHDAYKTRGDEKDPENPLPTGTLRYEASSDGSNDGSEEWPNAVERSS
jgi:hypothetical protein